MKYLLLFAVTLIMVTPVLGQNRKYDKAIASYDVAKYVKSIPGDRPDLFWNAVVANNKRIQEMLSAAEKKTALMRRAQAEYSKMLLQSEEYNNTYQVYDVTQITDTLLEKSGLKAYYSNFRIEVIAGTQENAFTTPEGTVYLIDKLLEVLEFDYGRVMGVVAHEASHSLLMHILSAEFARQKSLRDEELAAALSSVVAAASTAVAQSYGAADEETWKGVNENIRAAYGNIARDVQERFVPKYGRSQETEADIIAYRFLEWLGIGGDVYIEALRTIAPNDDSDYDSTSDHPRTSERIALLEYMGDRYPLKN